MTRPHDSLSPSVTRWDDKSGATGADKYVHQSFCQQPRELADRLTTSRLGEAGG
jgi:hypothetical protein